MSCGCFINHKNIKIPKKIKHLGLIDEYVNINKIHIKSIDRVISKYYYNKNNNLFVRDFKKDSEGPIKSLSIQYEKITEDEVLFKKQLDNILKHKNHIETKILQNDYNENNEKDKRHKIAHIKHLSVIDEEIKYLQEQLNNFEKEIDGVKVNNKHSNRVYRNKKGQRLCYSERKEKFKNKIESLEYGISFNETTPIQDFKVLKKLKKLKKYNFNITELFEKLDSNINFEHIDSIEEYYEDKNEIDY